MTMCVAIYISSIASNNCSSFCNFNAALRNFTTSRAITLSSNLKLMYRTANGNGRCLLNVRAYASGSGFSSPDDDGGGGNEGDNLVAKFMHHVISTQQSWPLEGRTPTPLMPPHTVVKVQMDALMRNDWPEDDSGIRTAFLFSKPYKVEEMRVGQAIRAARAWKATESYLSFEQFVTHIKESQYAPMVYCLNWEAASSVIFYGGDWQAVQAVKVTAENADGCRKEYIYTFFLEKICRGPYKDIWMVVGVKLGDYANV